jgi:hypothetical protein
LAAPDRHVSDVAGEAAWQTDAAEREGEVTQRVRSAIIVVAMFALLGWRLMQFLGEGWTALHWPFELDYGEGIVWQQANMMFGPGAFGPIDGFPAIVFHYTPFFHVLTLGLSQLTGLDMLIAGRAVALGFTALSGWMIALLAMAAMPAEASRRAKIVAASAGALLICCMWPVTYWAQLMRVDMPAYFFSLLGFWLGLKAFDRPSLIYHAAIAFVAAIYTKQTSIAAPAALFGVMLWLRPALALRGIAACAVLGSAVLALLTWLTSGGFIRHIFLYNINRFEMDRLTQLAGSILLSHVVLIVAALAMIGYRIANLRALRKGQTLRAILDIPAQRNYVALLAYFVLATLMLVLIAKSGSAANYTIEWLYVLAIFVGLAMTDAGALAAGGPGREGGDLRSVIAVIGVPAAIAAHSWSAQVTSMAGMANPARAQAERALSKIIAASDKPVISDEMVLVIRSGKPVVWEPAIFAELASKDVWDEKPFVAKILNHDFSMFITVGTRGSRLFDSRYNPAVADAMDRAYPRLETMAGYTVHFPAVGAGTQ